MNRFGPLSCGARLAVSPLRDRCGNLEDGHRRQTRRRRSATIRSILLPLRQPADYRRESGNHLQWLSRRWIYNIPRSAQTQSFRPLGRLAFVDHLDRVMERLTRAIKAAVDREALAASAQKHRLAVPGGVPAGFPRLLDLRRDRQRHGDRRRLRGPQGSAGSRSVGRGTLRHPGPLLRPQSPKPRPGRGQCLCLLDRTAPLQRPAQRLPGRSAPADCRPSPPRTLPSAMPTWCTWAKTWSPTTSRRRRTSWPNTCIATPSLPPARSSTSAAAGQGRTSHRPVPIPAVRTFGLAQLGFSYDDIPATAVDELCKALVTRWRGIDAEDADLHARFAGRSHRPAGQPFHRRLLPRGLAGRRWPRA